ncbi:MAG: MATE family efflux transporter [Defluviitaleaceae bacterium]|nr:MATE family efflux transporter [Defluviitaleaceae bacterium]
MHDENTPTANESIAKIPTWTHLLKFSLPTIMSILIMSTFGIVDGIFVSRLIDPNALAPVSIVFPFLGFVMAIGFMLGVGGNALIAKKIGEGKAQEAKENFSLITLISFLLATSIAAIGIIFPDFILSILGTDEYIHQMALSYMLPLLYFLPLIVLGMVFQQFLITAGKAHYSAITAFLGGSTSAGLNFLFIYVMDMGLQGAAFATSIGYSLSAIVGLTFFIFNRKGSLHFVRPRLDLHALGRTCINGASEMVTMISISITSILMNNILLDLEGHEAVAAAGIMFAGMGIFSSLFIGYASGVMPIISYNFGKNDTDNLKKVYVNSLRLIGVISVISVVLAVLSVDVLISIYDVPIDTPIHNMARTGFLFIAASFILMSFNAFSSMFFTALNNGIVSSVLSFFRTLIFISIAFLTLPHFFGLYGVWAAIPTAEVLGIIMTIFFFWKMKKVYKYA